ncbi:NAD(P)/FAD-dependent oxidoreductase [Saccharospirillum mangrovi]|uniref:NAD(P)/FAD-dependent oxidoreductase n=1 Tax=Saccharospirillum mangrovi TaxID=2161747 RepID=UPI000D389479|nr:NAD(P)/FAD-dependent oxidoreductase [Saccharospirillum mangrovi]
MQQVDTVIIGGGAAGLMCAATAGARGRSVRVIEHAKRVGKKILMSGGGRCNFTNLDTRPANFLSANPHFCKSALSRYTPWDFLALVDGYGLAYHEKTPGQFFCDDKAKDLLDILIAECDRAGVDIRTQCSVTAIDVLTDTEPYRFQLATSAGTVQCQSLVIATGGLSIPTLGATGFGYQIAGQFGLDVLPRRAGLVPFTLSDRWLDVARELAGVSVDVRVDTNNQTFSDAMLFTHRGLSGPALLQISNYWQPGDALTVDFLPTLDVSAQLDQWRHEGAKAEVKTLLSRLLPSRFVHAWLAADARLSALAERRVAELNREALTALVDAFQRWRIVPAGTEGYRTAEVTLGGVSTEAVSSKTFEAKAVPGLYFVGEVLDVTGWLGGYNFQWAWASGWCAGQVV